MRRSLQIFLLAGTLCALVSANAASVVGVATAEVATAPRPAADSQTAVPGDAADMFLGFEVGEERRYTIGPQDAMLGGESVLWTIRLDRVEAAAGRSVGVFDIGHSERRWGVSLEGSILVAWNYAGEARINEFGFPEELRFTMFEEHTGEAPWRGALMSVSYVLAGSELVKTIGVPNQEWRFEIPVATHDDLDLDVPSGMFLFRPQAGGIDFFMHPALLGFAIPEVVPEGWKQRFMFFRPTYPVRNPGAGYASIERDTVAALRRYYVKRTLELKEPMELEIGGRTLNVRKVDVSGPVRDAYIDEFGRVVRIDLDPDPVTRKNRYLRLLFPSEY